jgi:sugar phosphate isomerase/epimerase
MTSRREFLTTMALGAAALRANEAEAADPPEIKTALNGPVGLQLYSLREELKKDVPGTLARVRAFGIREVESAGTWGQSPAEHRAALDKAGLVCRASHMGLEKLQGDAAGAFKEVMTLGARWVVCPWIPHDKAFTRDDALKAADAFNGIAKAAKGEGLRFAYHCHGYEFVPSAEGTLFDTLVGATDKDLVSYEIDVFWAKAGGADPAKVIEKLSGRVPFLHVKDMKKGVSFPAGTSHSEPEGMVPVGTGQVDWPSVFRAAMKGGAEVYYIEDESLHPLTGILQSIQYLAGLKL